MKFTITMCAFIASKVGIMALAAYLILHQVDGWGWFLIVAFIYTCGTSYTVEEK